MSDLVDEAIGGDLKMEAVETWLPKLLSLSTPNEWAVLRIWVRWYKPNVTTIATIKKALYRRSRSIIKCGTETLMLLSDQGTHLEEASAIGKSLGS
jgi:hypothetical protein